MKWSRGGGTIGDAGEVRYVREASALLRDVARARTVLISAALAAAANVAALFVLLNASPWRIYEVG